MLSRTAIFSSRKSRNLLTHLSKTHFTSQPPGDDNTLWRRPIRQDPGKVRMGFVPDEWFTFFYKKTGVTGPYTFIFTFVTFLISKELYVLDHNFYNGLSWAVIWIVGIKKYGPRAARYLDKEIDEYEAQLNKARPNPKVVEAAIAHEARRQWSMEGQKMLLQAKRENVALQLEAAYRERLMKAYKEVKNRLDYQVEKAEIERKIAEKNLVEWVVREVKGSLQSDKDKEKVDGYLSTLKDLFDKTKG